MRDDWSQLSELQECQQKFAAIVGDPQFSSAEKQSRLAALWPVFVQDLAGSPSLTDSDRQRIAGIVSTALLNRLKLQE